jgi:hypothetical protein
METAATVSNEVEVAKTAAAYTRCILGCAKSMVRLSHKTVSQTNSPRHGRCYKTHALVSVKTRDTVDLLFAEDAVQDTEVTWFFGAPWAPDFIIDDALLHICTQCGRSHNC